jgi:membrane-associated phospholipid phosphatase
VLVGVLVGISKTVFGRERPRDSNGKTSFKPFSGNGSFPSSHAAQAFAVASVISSHSQGWIIPTTAYGLATLVAFDRVYANAHFPSDVFAGAALGTAVGHYLVARHTSAAARPEKVGIEVFPTRGGVCAAIVIRP